MFEHIFKDFQVFYRIFFENNISTKYLVIFFTGGLLRSNSPQDFDSVLEILRHKQALHRTEDRRPSSIIISGSFR